MDINDNSNTNRLSIGITPVMVDGIIIDSVNIDKKLHVIEPIDYSKELDDEMLERELLITFAIDSFNTAFSKLSKHHELKLITILQVCPPRHWPKYIVHVLKRTSDKDFWKSHPYFSE